MTTVRLLITLALSGFYPPSFTVLAASATKLKTDDILTWPGVRADEFGCFLERAFARKDPKFNCALKRYKNRADPCKNADAYAEGPVFPQNMGSKISPIVERVELIWEHGNLQAIQLTLKKKMSSDEVKKAFKFSSGNRPNVISFEVEACGIKSTCVQIQGFDHLGTGDLDCEIP